MPAPQRCQLCDACLTATEEIPGTCEDCRRVVPHAATEWHLPVAPVALPRHGSSAQSTGGLLLTAVAAVAWMTTATLFVLG